jgi:class 3 adenylate cyclase/ketosteroid isomerase-like protein/tetratricopeptide (TPR) repeat protein
LCGHDLPPAARFCDACGTPVAAPAPPQAPARKVVTAVFGDLVGSTALHETLDPESVRGVMARFYEVMRGVVHRWDGHLEKFLGDGVVVVFGIPSVGEDDALRAVGCGSAMVAALAALDDELHEVWGVRLRMRVGVDSGELVISGDGELVGDAMNTAARLQQSAAPGEVLIGEATWRIVRHGVQLEPVEPLVLKGKAAPTRAWRLVSAEPDPDGTAAGVETPLVGRVPELRRLHVALDDAVRTRSCRLVTVIGSPGVGKTRLAGEFAGRVGGGDGAGAAAVVRSRCEHLGEGITFLPVAELLRGAGGIAETDPPEVVRARLAALVGDEPDAATVVTRAASLLGAAEAVPAEETLWGVRRVLEALARRAPLVVVFDDLHWGQPLFLDLVEHLVEWVRDAPILVVALARPELRELRESLTVPGRRAGDSPARRAADVIELAPLDAEQSRRLVRALVGSAELPRELLELILETAGGNPLFLGETLRMLVDDGLLTDRGKAPAGGWAMQVPPTISALLSARVERLRFEERAVVERAAVIGKQFHRGALAALLPAEVGADLGVHLDALRRKELIEPDGPSWEDGPYRFANVLIRDAAYRGLLKQSRAELHERFADWLAAKAGDQFGTGAGEHEEVIAYHLEQAHGYLRELGPLDPHGRALGVLVVSLLHAAGRRALAREDLAAAASMLRRALDRADRGNPELLWDLADVLLTAGDTAAAAEVVRRYAALGEETVPRARADVLIGHLSLLTGDAGLIGDAGLAADAGLAGDGEAREAGEADPDPDGTVERLTAAAAELTAAGDSAAAAEAHLVAARGHRQQGRFGACVLALDRALVAARRAGDRRRVTEALAAAPRATLWGPTPVVRASGRCLDVLRIVRMTPGNRHVEPIALRCQAVLEAMRGRFDAARAILVAGRATTADLGQPVERYELAAHAGMIELLAGDPVAAHPHLVEARDGFAALGIGVSAARAAALLARACVEVGRDDEALAATRYAEDHAGGDLRATVTWTGVRAEVLARRGEADAAVRLARHAVAVSEPTDALPDRAEAWLVLARVFVLTGRTGEVDAAAKSARALYEAKGHTVGAAWTTELTGSPAPTRQRLATALASLGDEAPGRFVARMVRRWATGSVDAVLELYADDWRLVDHSHFGWGELRGLDEAREALGMLVRSGPTHLTVTEKLSGDDRVLAFTGILPGSAPGPALEPGPDQLTDEALAMGFVIVVEDGRLVEQHTYEPDARERMLADYARLGGRPGVLGHRAPERAVAAFCRPWTPGEADELLGLFPDDVLLVDHRDGESWVFGSAGLRRRYTELLERVRVLHVAPDEVLACDDRVIALRATSRGADRNRGGEVTAAEYVLVVEDGRVVRVERYQPHDTAAVLARYAELGGSHTGLGDRPPERLFAELLRRSAGGGSVRELFGEDFLMVDHRRLGWEDVTGAGSAVELLASLTAMAPDMQVVVDDVLACDDRVIAAVTTARGTAAQGGGPLMLVVGWLVTVRDGRVERAELFEPEDRASMVARYAELGGGLGPLGGRPPERVWAESARRYAARDLDGLAELIAADWWLVDHRSLGWEEVRGRDGALDYVRSGFEATTDSHLDVAEVLACDDRVIALRMTLHGTSVDGVRFEHPLAVVGVVEDGRIVTREQFDHTDLPAMLDRWTELSAEGRERP